MIYRALRWVSGIMLHWFYSEIRIEGSEQIPPTGPMLVAVNHPNAMVDSLIAGWVVPRRLRITATATLLGNPAIAVLFKLLGVVPLKRAADQTVASGDRMRNKEAFEELLQVLGGGGAVLIFPEGRSNSDELLPLKTGLARIALEAKQSGVRNLWIVPIGLHFEEKGTPGSRVSVRVADPIALDEWSGDSAHELTDVVTARLTNASRRAAFPLESPSAEPPRPRFLIRAATWWGRTTHDIPIRYARALAVSRSSSADEPAMLTMIFGIALVLASYAIHIAVIGLVTRSLLFCAVYLLTLVAGAYWTAFEGHRR
ncbi:MAG: lysophospholipid acyltransferase family protein [Gemmatimonadota bacterium]|nr:lysophospholipid acyltransferase family protein [Gemmatimonadota bacterium]